MADLSVLIGMTLSNVKNYGESILFTSECGRKFQLHHYQDCCESVEVESIVGELDDLVGSVILTAEEVSSLPDNDGSKQLGKYEESFTWTFYKFSTRKGYVDIRFYGTSNGYYSESVSFDEIGAE